MPTTLSRHRRTDLITGTAASLAIGYARVATTWQDLARQLHALKQVGIEGCRVYVYKKLEINMDRS